MLPDLDEFYLNQEEPLRSCFDALRHLIQNYDEDITQAWKYRMPCFCYKDKPFCYLWKDKKSNWPYILVVRGNKFEHPQLHQGERSKMKRFLIDPNQDLPIETIFEILDLAKQQY